MVRKRVGKSSGSLYGPTKRAETLIAQSRDNDGLRSAPKVLARRYCSKRLQFGTDKLFPRKAAAVILERARSWWRRSIVRTWRLGFPTRPETSSKTSSSQKAEDSVEHVQPSFSPRRTPANPTGICFC